MFTIGHVRSKKKGPRPGQFQRGNSLWKKAYQPKSDDDPSNSTSATDNKLVIPDRNRLGDHSTDETQESFYSSGDSTQVFNMVLRSSVSDLKRKDFTGMRLLDSEKMMGMMNAVYRQHKLGSIRCRVPEFETYQQEKKGLCWTYTVKCRPCGFLSQPFKLYKEVPTAKPGPNPGAPNVALASVLQDTPIGNSKAQEMLARLDCPPPNRSTMNRLSNSVGKETIALNKKDMAQKLELVKAANRKKGNPENEINITVDGRYNSQTITSKKKPGLNASQAFSLAVETVTGMNYIVAAVHQNQLCWKGAWLRGKGFNVSCPNGHDECTANLHRAAPLSEYTMGKDIGKQLCLEGILVKFATTDGDGRAAKGIDDAVRALNPLWKVTRLADYVHLGQTQFRAAMRARFSDGMFKGRTKELRDLERKHFCLDLKSRCSLVLAALVKKHNRKMEDVCKDLPAVLEATVRCYCGDCRLCKEHSMVCGGTEDNNWWTRSLYLPSYNITELKMERSDVLLLMELLKMKLSEEAVHTMELYNTTNKNEGVHRALSVNLPKNVNFSRNMEARLSSGVHSNNNKPGTSAKMKSSQLGLQLNEASSKYLDKLDTYFQHESDYD